MIPLSLRPSLSWALVGVAILAVVLPSLLPWNFTMLESGQLRVWPHFVFHGLLVGAWFFIWLASLRRDRIPNWLAVATLAVTAWPWVGLSQSWSCVQGHCYW